MNEEQLLELNELCQGLFDDRLTREQMARLSAILRESEEARRVYVRAAALSASLHQYASELQAEPPAPRKIVAFPSRRTLAWVTGALAAAAAISLLFHLPVLSPETGAPRVASSGTDADDDDSIARITGSKDCAWQGKALGLGDEVRPGQRLRIASGFLEVSFDSGAQLTVEGPAELEATDAWQAALRSGSLRANVPAESAGFRVTHPSVEVVDLGTEFTMAVDERGEAEVFVLKGEVEAHPRGAAHPAAMLLRERESRHFARAGVSEVKDRDRKLAHWARRVAFDRVVAAPHFARWSFDNPSTQLTAQSIGLPSFTLLGSGSDSAQPRKAEGRWAGALALDGRPHPFHADLSALPAGAGRTVACWVRIPADAPLTEGGPILAWTQSPLPAPIELRWNRDPAAGVIGALQTQLGNGFRTGVVPLRDGRWHHIAVTFSASPKGRMKPQIKQYVDARLDGVSARRGLKLHRRQESASGAPALFVGGAPAEASGFQGELDELVVTDRPLAPGEIRRLMQENRLE
jgi:ferric-dicitrate binding protein FerR (iron transport regulator)